LYRIDWEQELWPTLKLAERKQKRNETKKRQEISIDEQQSEKYQSTLISQKERKKKVESGERRMRAGVLFLLPNPANTGNPANPGSRFPFSFRSVWQSIMQYLLSAGTAQEIAKGRVLLDGWQLSCQVKTLQQIIARGMWELRIRRVGTPARTWEILRVAQESLSSFFSFLFFSTGVAVNGHSLT